MIGLRKAPELETLKQMADRYPEFDARSLHFALCALVISSDIEAALDRHFAHYGLSHGRFVVLVNLYSAPNHELLPSAIADLVRVSRATMTSLLTGLERAGLIKRHSRPSTDRRTSPVRLTSKGRALLERVLPDHYARLTKMVNHLTRAEQRTLLQLMEKLHQGLSELHGTNKETL
jgi:DNA-binding MarR family transcriptional regulator